MPYQPPSMSTINSPTPMPSHSDSMSSLGPYKPVLILHGGAGSISRSLLPPDLYAKYHASLLHYLTSTHQLLQTGSSAIIAACHAVTSMEDDPLFNCGRGSVFTSAGRIEMEASLAVTSITDNVQYEGNVKRSAAVSMITQTRHPILLAREVLKMGDGKSSPELGDMHGHLSGPDVEEWGFKVKGLERKGPEWFWTKRRWEEHLRGLKPQDREADGIFVSDRKISMIPDELADLQDISILPSQGTVGAVCMDSWGVIAAATSTGGLTNKNPGRIGDTPTVGAGFWAESWTESIRQEVQHTHLPELSIPRRLATMARTEAEFWLGDCVNLGGCRERISCRDVQRRDGDEKQLIFNSRGSPVWGTPNAVQRRAVAVSGTGNGDSFLRANACRTVAAISRFGSAPLSQAIHAVAGPSGELQKSAGERWSRTGEGEGGIIGIEMTTGGQGKAMFDFNCGGLWRAYFEMDGEKEKPRIMVFREEY